MRVGQCWSLSQSSGKMHLRLPGRTLSWICPASKTHKLAVTGAHIPWPCVYRIGTFFFNAKLLKLFCSNVYIFLVILFGNISFDFFLGISHVSTSYPALLHILYAQISVLSHYPCFSALLFLAHGNINTYDYFLFLQQWQTMKINHRSCTTNNWTILNICYRKSLNRAELKSKMKYISIV